MSDKAVHRQAADDTALTPVNGSASGQPAGDEARQMLDSLMVGVLKVAHDGRILYANALANRMLLGAGEETSGHTAREFETRTIWPDGSDCTYEEYPPIKCLRTGEYQPGVTLGLKMPGDRILWMTVTAEPLLDPSTGQPESALVTVVPSGDPQHVEEALRQSEERYRRLIENSPDAIIVHQGGPILFVNEAGVKLWRGRSRQDFIGRQILDFVHPRDRANAKQRIQNALSGQRTPLIEQRHIRLDGTTCYVEVTGTSCVYDGQRCVQVVFRDVTLRKRAERQIRRQRELLKIFFKRVPVLVAIYDRHGRAKEVNREWERVIGYGKERKLDDLLRGFYPDPAMRQEAIAYMQAAKPGWRDFDVCVADGSVRTLSWANIVLSSGDRIGIALDVTEYRQAEALLRQAKSELERRVAERTEELTNKNAELRRKQRFMERSLSVQERERKLVAYEIHDTILQEVIGALMYVDTIYENADAGAATTGPALDKARKLLRKCIDEARQMISGLRPPVIDEQGVVGAIDYLVSEFNARGMAIRYTHVMPNERLEPELETTIFRIVQEALNNVDRHSGSRQADVRLGQRGDTVHIEVQDPGNGFDVEAVGEGHYGLEGIRERARLMGGWASIQSQLGQGTQVIVELPAKPQK